MVLLCIVFFGMASWNLGLVDAPTSTWKATSNQHFYVDLGSSQQVQIVYFWVQQGNASVTVSTGSPDIWVYLGQYALIDRDTDYWVWHAITVNSNTRYLDFNVTPSVYDSRPNFYWSAPNPSDQLPSPYTNVLEIGVSNPSNVQIPIVGIIGENNTDATLNHLVDEQNTVQVPPTYMSKMIFDEVYFARSAIDFVNHQIPLERTHPPLGKLIQAVGVAAFGVTPFGWRVMGVIFGTFIVAMMYLLGKKLFGTWIGGFSAAFLMTFDFLHFTMARLGTVDTYMIFFSLLSQLFFLIYVMNLLKVGWKQASVLPLVLAVAAFSCGFSTKFGFPLFNALGLLALLVALRFRDVVRMKGRSLSDRYVAFFDRPAFLLIACVGLVAAIYFATYIPEMLMGDSIGTIYNLQLSMIGFHTGSVVDSSATPWWSWPIMFGTGGTVPKWFDISYIPPANAAISTIYAFGNPVVWWLGFALMLVLVVQAFRLTEFLPKLWRKIRKSDIAMEISARRWDVPAVYIVVVFAFSWLPYVFVGRAAYIYHFYLSVPLICLAITYFINKYWNKRLGKVAAIAVFAAAVAMFVLFYPVISGALIPSTYIHNYLDWFPSRFYAP
jgi:dolichyl-phosphate-mannose-protein mannosyltransferase